MNVNEKLVKLLLVALLVLLPQATVAKKWELDRAHSNIYFNIDHIFSKVNGHFGEFSADVDFDPADLAGSQFTFEIKTSSIDTALAKRDKHLQSTDFFDVKKFPVIVYKSEKIVDAGNSIYELHGKLMVKGESYALVLPLTLAGVKDHPAVKGKQVAGFNGKLSLDRLVYKIGRGKFYEMGVVGKDVEVLVSIELLSAK